MKKIGFILFLVVLTGTVISCRKDSNSLTGTIQYIHPATGAHYYATLGTISLYKDDGLEKGLLANYSTKIDEKGYYNFPRINKGDYKAYVYYTYDNIYFYDTIINLSFKLNDKKIQDVLLIP